MVEIEQADVVSIQNYFKELDDPRSSVNRKHLLGDLIVICICGVLSGADGPSAISLWAESHSEWLHENLALPKGIPSHDTIGRLLALLKPEAFQACFEEWIATLRGGPDSGNGGGDEVVAIDGKTLRRSHDRKRNLGPLHLVSAWSVTRGVSLGQLAAGVKSNEITAIPALIDAIDVRGAIITIDAAGCQKSIAAKIIDNGGDYVLTLKGNQGTLYTKTLAWIDEQASNDFQHVAARSCWTTAKAHGRHDTIHYIQFLAPKSLPDTAMWKKLRTIGVAIRSSLRDGEEVIEIRYFLSSLPLGVKRFATAVRGHWGIETTLHWTLDVTFREDDSRLRNRLAADNLAWLKRFAISLLKQQKDKQSLVMRRRMAGWNVQYMAQILGLKGS